MAIRRTNTGDSMSAWKWYAGAVTSSLAPLIPAIGDPLSWKATKVAGAFGRGATRLHPVGMALGAAQVGYMAYTRRGFILRESQFAVDRMTGRDNPAAWRHTPKMEFAARRKHGYLVSGSDRMVRNPPMMSSRDLVARESRRFS